MKPVIAHKVKKNGELLIESEHYFEYDRINTYISPHGDNNERVLVADCPICGDTIIIG